MKHVKKTIASIMTGIILLGNVLPVAAIDIPSAPTPPTAPSIPTPPSAPEIPSAPSIPSGPNDSNSNQNNTNNNDDQNRNRDDRNREDRNNRDRNRDSGGNTGGSNQNQEQQQNAAQNQTTPSPTPTEVTSQEQNLGNQSAEGQKNAAIATGNANNTVALVTNANSNLAATPSGNGSGIAIANTGNGASSNNHGSASVSNNSATVQNNTATVESSLNLDTNTGKNDASKNMGNTTITTGDANTSGTIVNSINSNVAGVMVSEFNIVDDQVGDLVLDFAANCIAGCGGTGSITNTRNGAYSDNTGTLDVTNNNETFQTNDATVTNTMVLDSNSGDNRAEKNTGGNTSITTGNANVSASALTFANNNIAGGVVYGVVNIYGDLIGDIIFPEEALSCCGMNTKLANTGNGAYSDNLTTANLSNNDQTFQTNNAVIDNIVYADATTGGNDVSKNTSGNNSVTTGNANVDVNVVNIANSNVDGGAWWLVLINEAGNWVGKIMGAEGGATMAGSAGTEFRVSPSGEITVTNGANGAGSTNTGSVTQQNNNTTVQTNDAHITNVLDLSANTGGNQVSKNTGGDNTVTTGDANIMANILNFVNNNITGAGQLFVTVVNIFPTGSWLGDFVSPGQKKDTQEVAQHNTTNQEATSTHQAGTGGADVSPLAQTSNNTETQSSAPSPTPSVTVSQSGNNISFSLSLAGLTDGNTRSGDGTSTGGLSEGSVVLGTTETAGAAQKTARTVTINLLWLILALPCAIFLIALKKRVRLTGLPHFSLPLKRIASALNSLL